MNRLPRFWFGQAVTVHSFSQERNWEMRDSGVIVGICYQVPDFLVAGWWYAIQFSQMDSFEEMPLGHVDWAHESDIRLVSILYTQKPGKDP